MHPVSAQSIGCGPTFQTGGDAHESVGAFNVVPIGREPATGQARFGELRRDALKGLEGPKPGDCCVFCSYGKVPCPSMQAYGKPNDCCD